MNDTELDQLLDTWKAPAPTPSLGGRLRARFPRAERTQFPRPLRWGLVTLLGAAALTVAVAQTGESHADVVMHMVNHVYTVLVFTMDSHRAPFIRNEIRQSQPRVYVDGQLVDPLEYRGGATLVVHVPRDGAYAATWIRYVDRFAPGLRQGWVEAGRIHDNVVEFEAGGKQVRIECKRPIIDGERPVFVAHLDE